jgi:hypothetical protein
VSNTTSGNSNSGLRYLVVGLLVLGAFFGAYRFASARSAGSVAGASTAAASGLVPASGTSGSGGSGAACACCGSTAPTEGGVTGEKAVGAATVEGDVQRISVDLSKGYYDPNQIVLKAGVPAEITFGQSQGCTAQVVSQDLGFSEDLTAGARTVKLPALEKGEYSFSCGMQMVFGKIVVE